jgi:hypothetical protein
MTPLTFRLPAYIPGCSATVVLLPDPELAKALEKEEQDKLAAKRSSLGPKEVGPGGGQKFLLRNAWLWVSG